MCYKDSGRFANLLSLTSPSFLFKSMFLQAFVVALSSQQLLHFVLFLLYCFLRFGVTCLMMYIYGHGPALPPTLWVESLSQQNKVLKHLAQ